jgi:hypothetical protein
MSGSETSVSAGKTPGVIELENGELVRAEHIEVGDHYVFAVVRDAQHNRRVPHRRVRNVYSGRVGIGSEVLE